MDEAEKLLRQLTTAGEEVEHPVLNTLQRKLTNFISIKLEEQKSINEEWTVSNLRQALEHLCQVQESAVQERGFPAEQASNFRPPERRTQGVGNPRTSSSAFVIQERQPIPQLNSPSCILCMGPHYTDECLVYRSLESRKMRLRQQGRCFLCLRQNCSARNCQQPRKRCYHCSMMGQHSRVLCPNKFGSRGSQPWSPHPRVGQVFSSGPREGYPSSFPPRESHPTYFVPRQEPPRSTYPRNFHTRENQQQQGNSSGPREGRQAYHGPNTSISAVKEHNPRTFTNQSSKISDGQARYLTTRVRVIDPQTGKSSQSVALLDSASDGTYVKQSFADKMGLQGRELGKQEVTAFGQSQSVKFNSRCVRFELILVDGSPMEVEAHTVPILTGPMVIGHSLIEEDKYKLEEILELQGANNILTAQPCTVEPDILIGLDYYYKFVTGEIVHELPSGLFLVYTKLGYIVSGRTKLQKQFPPLSCVIHQLNSEQGEILEDTTTVPVKKFSETIDLRDFWSLENIGIWDHPSNSDDEAALQQFTETVGFQNGRFVVTWPWKVPRHVLQDNFPVAIGRFRHLARRLQTNQALFQKYNNIIQEQLAQGIIEVADNALSDCIHYIPHHPVLTPQKSTTKVRVVYDASSKPNDAMKSLNECLLKGPSLMPDLVGVLIRFRLNKIGMCADIEKAFLQLSLNHVDRDTTRFFWFKHLETGDPNDLQIYRFTRIPFGVISSPFLLNATLQHYLTQVQNRQGNKTSQKVAELLASNIYVDNLVTGADTVTEAQQIFSESRMIFSQIRMNLREWFSNSTELTAKIPETLQENTNPTKVLGVTWDHARDTLSIVSPKVESTSFTKRTILGQIASIFDPAGLFSPVTLQGKVFIKKLWELQIGWDETIPSELLKDWWPIHKSLNRIHEVKFPRHVGLKLPNPTETKVTNELVAFVDASAVAYACCIYLKRSVSDVVPIASSKKCFS